MSEPGEDVFGIITGRVPVRSSTVTEPPSRIPLWKLEEMAGTGASGSGEGWRGSAVATGHVRPRSWPVRAVRATGTFLREVGRIMVRTLSFVALLALVTAVGLFLHGDLPLPGLDAFGMLQPRPSAVPAPAVPPALPAAPAPAAPAVAAPVAPDAPIRTPRTVADRPTAGYGAAPHPLGAPAPLAATGASYAFMQTADDGTPFTYDPCRAIHYVTRAANSPAVGPRLIAEAIASVSRATGLVFINDGPTTEAPAPSHASFQPDRYGDRWAPLLIAWETAAEDPRFTDTPVGTNVLGLGGSEAVSIGGSAYTYVSGQLELNGPALQRMIGSPDGINRARGVIEHELAHVVGLGHVEDEAELMNPSATQGVSGYQSGDLTGLAALGQGKCQPGL